MAPPAFRGPKYDDNGVLYDSWVYDYDISDDDIMKKEKERERKNRSAGLERHGDGVFREREGRVFFSLFFLFINILFF